MTGKTPSLRERLRAARPEVVEHQKANAHKREIAIQLRNLRDARGMTQKEVAEASGLTQSVVSRLEALTGPTPQMQSIERYVEACDGHMALVISSEEIPAELRLEPAA
ncbi:hypothetical protein DLJ53_30215 [Acuticoccus sediminis]|uniref:HTH cro/C1-type domain-containing protein n=1 Tax=Acuticoccus sediminis TaxID=2184697 RepID=A0A8B2NL31_9HYPH|nr:helix-turn-helix transcriptional regulator [Acuticoccus sediminis]RAH96956.1 hypothetical protein DLJ53_30215 [Acuticoccus sediminis]